MKKKNVAILLTVLLGMSVLAGCGADEAGESSSGSAGSSESGAEQSQSLVEESSEEAGERYTFTMVKSTQMPPDKNSDVELYWEERLGCDFEVIYFEPTNAKELLNLELASGNVPDVFGVDSRTELLEMYEQGYIGGITEEFLQENAPLMYEDIMRNGEHALDIATIDGLIYTLPSTWMNYSDYEFPTVWNLDWLEAVGFEGTPTTLEEFEEVLRKFVTEDPDGNGKDDTYGFSKEALNMFYGAFGVAPSVWIEQEDGTVAYDIMQEGSREALEWLAKMYADGVIDPEFITGENKGGYWAISHAFAEERIGLTGIGSYYHWIPKEAQEQYGLVPSGTPTILEETNPDLNFGFGSHPVGPDGDYGIVNANGGTHVGTVFSKKLVENEEKLKEFLRIAEITCGLHDNYDYFVSKHGIEGDRWDLVNGVPVVKAERATIEDEGAVGGNSLFCFYTYNAAQKANAPGQYEWIGSVYPKLQLSDYLNVIVDALPSAGDYLEEIKTYLGEAKIAIITGEKPIDYYDEVVETAREMGYDILEAEANELYNAN